MQLKIIECNNNYLHTEDHDGDSYGFELPDNLNIELFQPNTTVTIEDYKGYTLVSVDNVTYLFKSELLIEELGE